MSDYWYGVFIGWGSMITGVAVWTEDWLAVPITLGILVLLTVINVRSQSDE